MSNDRKHVLWQCPLCNVTMSGFLLAGESTVRFCGAIPTGPIECNSDGSPKLCGGLMKVIMDNRPLVDQSRVMDATESGQKARIIAACEAAIKAVIAGKGTAAEILEEMGNGLKGIRRKKA